MFFRGLFSRIRMDSPALERIISNNKAAEEILSSIKHEVAAAKNEKIARKMRELEAENRDLLKQIEQAKAELVLLETRNGKKQIPVPNQAPSVVAASAPPAAAKEPAKAAQAPSAAPPKQKEAKAPKEKPDKQKKEKKDEPPSVEPPVDIGRLDLRVGKIVDVQKHPDADALYLEKIDCGESAGPRTVISGLVNHVPIEEMQNRMVVVLCNLKPVKMRGIVSEAMVMCASAPEKVEVLAPPPGAVPGDLVHCPGFVRNPDAQMNPKKKIFETVAPDLLTNAELEATYKGVKWEVPGKGPIKAQSLKNVNIK